MSFSGRVGGGGAVAREAYYKNRPIFGKVRGGPHFAYKRCLFWKDGKGRPGGPRGPLLQKDHVFLEGRKRGARGPTTKRTFLVRWKGGPVPEGPLQEKTFFGRMRGRGPGARGAPCKICLFLKGGPDRLL